MWKTRTPFILYIQCHCRYFINRHDISLNNSGFSTRQVKYNLSNFVSKYTGMLLKSKPEISNELFSNILCPKQNDYYFASDMFNCIFFIILKLIESYLLIVPVGTTNTRPDTVWVMSWRKTS